MPFFNQSGQSFDEITDPGWYLDRATNTWQFFDPRRKPRTQPIGNPQRLSGLGGFQPLDFLQQLRGEERPLPTALTTLLGGGGLLGSPALRRGREGSIFDLLRQIRGLG